MSNIYTRSTQHLHKLLIINREDRGGEINYSFINMTKVLLVEDDPFLIDIYTTKLKAEGFDLLSAKDGEEAMEKIKSDKPALVILDIVLPNMDGWWVLKQIKEIKGAEKPKILVLSNLGQKEEVEKGLMLGADKYLIKSDFTPSQIVKELKNLI